MMIKMEDEIFCVNVFGTYVINDMEYCELCDVIPDNFDLESVRGLLRSRVSPVICERIWLSLLLDSCMMKNFIPGFLESIVSPTKNSYNCILAEIIYGVIANRYSNSAKILYHKYKFDPTVTKTGKFLSSTGLLYELETMSLESLLMRANDPEHFEWEIITFKPNKDILSNVGRRLMDMVPFDSNKMIFAVIVNRYIDGV